MTEPLTVDPSRLETAGAKLASLAFPPPPVPVTATGTDSVSSAIDETMPGIEAPAVDGLTAAQSALNQTSSNIATAAAMYASTDRQLGDQFSQSQFDQAALSLGGISSLGGLLKADTDTSTSTDTKQIASTLNALSQTTQTVGSTTQSIVQSIQGAASNTSSAAPASAKTVSDTKADPAADEAQDDEKDKEKTEGDEEQLVALSEGAAPAQQATAGAGIPRGTALA